MKIHLFIIVIAFSLCTCNQNKTANEKARRFTFAVPSSTVLPSRLSEIHGSIAIEVFELNNQLFLIVDAPVSHDYDKLMKALQSERPDWHALLRPLSPLERVYKLDQEKEFSATRGQLIAVQKDAKRHVLTLEIVNDPAIKAEYKRVHAKGMAWPEITRNMKQVGIKDMEIYLDGYQAYLVIDTKKDFDLTKDGEAWSKLPRESEWQEYVAKFQKVDPQSKAIEKWQTMISLTGQAQKKYEENWESLKHYTIPQWMKDAKFGIFIHWGPNSVAELYTDWYPRWMYLDSGNIDHTTGEYITRKPHPAVAYHRQKFGDQKEFGYKDLLPLWTMENFNPKEWVDLFKKAGAQYVIPVAEHHDGFALYESSITPYHAATIGPKRDVFKELADETRKQGLIFGASSHLAFNWNYYNQQEYFDTGNPRYADLYAPQHERNAPVSEEWLAQTWWPRTKEIIDKYQPDILWFDFYLDRPEFAPYHKKLAAYYYNSGLERGKNVVLQTKNLNYESYRKGTHMLDLERSKMDSLRSEYWQTDTSIGKNSWYYAKNWIPKTAGELIADLVDIASKNGCLLLNIGPRKDGIIPMDQQKTLLEIGEWLALNGEAIYGSEYWEVYGEGPTETKTGHLSENKNKGFTEKDIRFTKNNNALYATILVPPTKDIHIKYLGTSRMDIQSVELLGFDGKLKFKQTTGGLMISLPTVTGLEHAWVFKIKEE